MLGVVKDNLLKREVNKIIEKYKLISDVATLFRTISHIHF
jgi:hypothetical protein